MSMSLVQHEARIAEEARADPASSNTARLVNKGIVHAGKKLGEEGVEAAIAAVGEDRSRVIGEAADLLYRLLIMLHIRDIPVDDVLAELGKRPEQSSAPE